MDLGRVGSLVVSQLGLTPDVLTDATFVWRAVPAGWQLRAFIPDRAVVAVWATGVAVARGRPLVQPGWSTTEVELVWERGGWRLVGFNTEPGPHQPAAASDAAGAAAARAINRFEPFVYLPAEGTVR